ncbi:BREX-1 system adenine-specific DNA-methyltransferase PglX [Burkholderia sp. Ac-20353]|uniref:BREX-1 system adenine-specific DNA-methyltransferase PglX n=1 Tax=Burkholderia sp. Ac-20353 TaxID=2703894 RepID=UPI00197BFA0E|nr:BREX-1 system adenine-specific DNA-methyltransferase PglX [Burkholderia sp. Ac-20353]MBN3791439.1 BREX-1 system adenine-specific DNA-methyltransferase PglX [Burkholderia sp. Ac-20353]
MNTNNIKRYAPKARIAFIAAMTKQAAKYGITSKGIEPLEQKGDLALIGDRPFPASMIRPRAALVKKVAQMGFAQAMEQAAYSWFNRLCAIRFMEIKGYLDHGRRVLSHPEREGDFQILDDCLDIELEGLDRQRITNLKLDGTKDEELYRELLLAQCHALHQAMPFLFEAIDDATELLLPDNLTKTDSLIRELVSAIPEEDWQEVEIIGWLYQFYISEKKDQVIGKVVKSEDIPAATQLFTPNWIVQYLVQNSLGRQWLQTYPDSPLKSKMPYYIEPAEQTDEVNATLNAITPDSIDPLTIKVLDPACGSGHILVEAYKVLKAIYEERGFRSRDIPQLILENNLFGLDIDDRAGQLAGFALMMLARKDDRRIFSHLAENSFKLNILPLQESSHLEFASLWRELNLTSDWQRGQSHGLFDSEQADLGAPQTDNRYQLLKTTLARFTQAKTFGSLIEVPTEEAEPLSELLKQLRQLAHEGDSMQKPAAEQLIPYVQQAWVLALRYDAVVANPPYMGGKGMNTELKSFAANAYPNSKSDLFAIFMEHAFSLLNPAGFNAQVNMQSWMFLSSYEKLREWLLESKTFITLAHLGARAFGQISGEVVQTTAWVLCKKHVAHHQPVFFRLIEGNEEEKRQALLDRAHRFDSTQQDDFEKIPGSPIAYWVPEKIYESFGNYKTVDDISPPRIGMMTTDNERFLKTWSEVSYSEIGFNFNGISEAAKSSIKWFPYNKGGGYRKWAGFQTLVVNWENGGEAIKANGMTSFRGKDFYFKEGLTWSDVATGDFSCRHTKAGFIFDIKGTSAFPSKEAVGMIACMLNSKLGSYILNLLNPTMSYQSGDIRRIPITKKLYENSDWFSQKFNELTSISYDDWNSHEESWGFKKSPLISEKYSINHSYSIFLSECNEKTEKTLNLEIELNRKLLALFDVSAEFYLNLDESAVTLNANPVFKYGKNDDINALNVRFRSDTLSDLVSYFVGCIMGRYSLDREGVIYAHAGNQGFAELVAGGNYKTFPADNDGILPLSDQEWFADDATNRFHEFVRTVWGEEHLQENLDFVAESLCLYAIKPKRGESALETIRRYLSTQFYKDHLKTYKKRPIYWLFSSGKHKAFECLVYLHRYHEGTLARMRTEYVIPLTAKLNTYANKLEQDIEASTSTAEKKRLEKELDTLHKQQAELATFDEKLRHFADLRISLDLDDGVKENYGKFGDLLAEVKAVTGDKAE